jgi:hypothetical protein
MRFPVPLSGKWYEEKLMSSYTGKCVLRTRDGKIVDVQVRDSAGMGITLSPEEYRARGIKPPLEELPDCSSSAPKK